MTDDKILFRPQLRVPGQFYQCDVCGKVTDYRYHEIAHPDHQVYGATPGGETYDTPEEARAAGQYNMSHGGACGPACFDVTMKGVYENTIDRNTAPPENIEKARRELARVKRRIRRRIRGGANRGTG